MKQAREIYTEWFNEVNRLSREANEAMLSLEGGGEDLQDFLESIATLLTFGPNPRAFSKEDL
jgi:hypothetical protein